MAKKEDKQSKVVLERAYNVPLRREYLKAPLYRRAKKAVTALRQFIFRHMKPADIKDIKIGKHLNHEIWAQGIRYPPHHIKIITAKYEDGIVRAELVGKPLLSEEKEGRDKRNKKKSEKKDRATKKGKAAKTEAKVDSKKTEEKETSMKTELKEDKKAEVKEDKKAEAKEKSKKEAIDNAESDDDIEYGDMSEDDFDDSEVVEKPKKKAIK